jgi:hypothetical protein
MKGADVTTNSQKMKALASAGFVPTERTFADYDYYTYLPTGTVIDSALKPLFFDSTYGSTTINAHRCHLLQTGY